MIDPVPEKNVGGLAGLGQPFFRKVLPAGLGSALVVYLIWAVLLRRSPPNWDAAICLSTARLFLNGKRLYVDIVDINPPLIVYLSVIPAALAALLSLPIMAVFQGFVLALCGLATLWLGALRRKGKPEFRIPALSLLAPLAGSAYAAFRGSFGEREHLFCLLLLPYLYWRWLEANEGFAAPAGGRRLSRGAGLACVVFSCLKPSLYLILLVYEFLLFRQTRRKFPYLPLLGPPVLYALHFLLLPAEVNRAFWQGVVPLVIDRYGTMGRDWPALFALWGPLFAATLLVQLGFSLYGRRSRGGEARLLQLLGPAGLVALFGAVLQKKGWDYHLLPSDFLVLFGTPILWRVARRSPSRGTLVNPAVCACLLLSFAPRIWFPNEADREDRRGFFRSAATSRVLARLVREWKHGGSAGPIPSAVVFSPYPMFAYPISTQLGIEPGTRYLFLYPLAFFNNTEARIARLKNGYPAFEELEPAERAFLREIGEDLESRRPRWLLFPAVNEPHLFLPVGFDSLAYLRRAGIFDRILNCYERKIFRPDLEVLERKEGCEVPGGGSFH